MKNVSTALAGLLVALLLACALPGQAPAKEAQGTGKVWRILYWEGGSFPEHRAILEGVLLGLGQAGLVDKTRAPAFDGVGTEELWQWLADQAGGDRVVFLKDGYHSSAWQEERRRAVKEAVAARVRTRKDVDLILALDSWSARDAADLELDIPVVCASVTSLKDSGLAGLAGRDGNVAVVADPGRYRRQVGIFHRIFHFSRLGIVYEDTPSGRAFMGLSEVEAAAEKGGFSLVRCTDTFLGEPLDVVEARLEACHRNLVQQGAQAVLLTLNPAGVGTDMARILRPLVEADLPTFSQMGALDVRRGVLLSAATDNGTAIGLHVARLMQAILAGARAGSLDTTFQSSGDMAINLATAVAIGWNPPLEVLASVGEFFSGTDDGAQGSTVPAPWGP